MDERHIDMAAKQRHVISVDDLTDADRQILDVLQRGARTKGAIIDETGLHRNTVGMRLDVLEAGDVVNRIHDRTALYELADDPRDDDAERSDTPGVGDLEAELRDLQSELSRVRNERDECREQLATLDTHASAEIEQARDALERALEDDAWTPVEDAAHYLGVEVDR